MIRKQTKLPASEMIEVGYPLPDRIVKGPLAPGQGRYIAEYEYRHFGVPKAVADICRMLDTRRAFGVHVSKIGGVDMLAELDMWDIRYRMTANAKRGTGCKHCWIEPEVLFRFKPGSQSLKPA